MHNIRFPDPQPEWTEDDARSALEEWRRSGKSIAVFARDRGMSAPRLYWWRRRLSQALTKPSPISLVPAAIVSAGTAATVIRLPNGLAVEIASTDVSPAWVAALVAELTRSPS